MGQFLKLNCVHYRITLDVLKIIDGKDKYIVMDSLIVFLIQCRTTLEMSLNEKFPRLGWPEVILRSFL